MLFRSAFDNVDFRHGTLETLPVDEGELDVALLSLVLHYVAEPQLALSNTSRALKRGGRLLLVDMLPHDRAEYRETMGHLWQGFSHQQLERWTTDVGLVDFRAHALPASPAAKGPTLFVASCTKP